MWVQKTHKLTVTLVSLKMSSVSKQACTVSPSVLNKPSHFFCQLTETGVKCSVQSPHKECKGESSRSHADTAATLQAGPET